jgi:CAAX amino terminal protease family.
VQEFGKRGFGFAIYAIFHTVSSSNNPIIDQVHQALNLKSVLPIILIYVLTALTTPIVEEVFFRGICYSIFKKRYGVLGGAIISGAIFGVAHLDPNSFVVLTLLGAGLAILYERTGRLSACIFAHFLWNTWFILAQFLLK